MATKLEAIKQFFTSGYTLHLEAEVAHLRGQNAMLHIQLVEALKPAPPAPVVARQFPKFSPPVKTSWEAFRDAEIARQEKEDQEENGTHSSGR